MPIEAKSEQFFGQVESLNINKIKLPSFRFRAIEVQEDIKSIANSIKQNGLLQPIIVRPIEDEYFEVVAGCTRYLACKSLHWRKIPCHIIHLNEMQMFEVALIENIQRKSISPMDEAKAFKRYVVDNGWGSVSELAAKIGKSPSYITKRISLLDLPADVQESIKKSELKSSTVEEILTVKDPEKQSLLAELIAKKHLTTMKARQLVKEKKEDDKKGDEQRTDYDPFYCENSGILEVRSELQPFNKAIVALRLAMNKIAEDMDEEGDYTQEEGETKSNIFINELLMYHKRLLHEQIGNLMRAKRKYSKNIYLYQKMMKM